MIHRLDWLPTGLSPSADFEAVVGVKKKVAGVGALDDDGISGGLRNVPASASAVAKKPTASVVAADADAPTTPTTSAPDEIDETFLQKL